ncbi:MAG: hypothetical protein WC455_01745 [Dehalococcoidia bacterium]|jgi:hypothetical protein
MELDGITNLRLSAFESRMTAIEMRLSVLEQGSGTSPKRRKRELTLEERKAVRARLVAGQEKARVKRELEAKAKAKSKA